MEGTAGAPQPFDPTAMRVSDADRHRVAEVLREAAGEGRLDLDELDERLDAAYGAKVYGDLVPLLVDLPGTAGVVPGAAPGPAAAARPGVPATAAQHDFSVAVMGACERRGTWQVGPAHQAYAVMGGVQIDLREAVFTSRETVITCAAFWGGIDVIVDERTQVVVEGVGIMGAFEHGRDKVEARIDADSPVVRVRGVALMAAVTVVRKGPREPRQRLGGGRRPELP